MHISFQSPAQFKLASEMVATFPQSARISLDSRTLSLEIQDEQLGRLVERLVRDSVIILPYFSTQSDYWLIASSDRDQLRKARKRVSSFLTPTYGEFTAYGGSTSEIPTPQRFDVDSGELQKWGAQLFDAGYYRLMSPRAKRDRILDRLLLWLDLEQQRPIAVRKGKQTYYQLNSLFQEALNSGDWTTAEHCLGEMTEQQLAPADNLIFLSIQLMSAQGKWQELWEDDRFLEWAALPMPPLTRTALLTAFHQVVLLPLENQNDAVKALEQFQRNRDRLGSLLLGPFEKTSQAVTRVRAYRAAADLDEDGFLSLLRNTANSKKTNGVLGRLRASIDWSLGKTPHASEIDQAVRALNDGDYEIAEKLSGQVKDIIERCLLLIELAFHKHDDALLSRRAWHTYESISYEEQKLLEAHPRFVPEYLQQLLDRVMPSYFDESSQPLLPSSPGDKLGADDLALEAWAAIGDWERRMRQIIRSRYEDRYPDDWEDRLWVSDGMRKRAQQNKEKDQKAFGPDSKFDAPLDYAYPHELVVLVKREWELFVRTFRQLGQPSSVARAELERLAQTIVRTRNPLAHFRLIPENELKRAIEYSSRLSTMIVYDLRELES